MSYDEAIAIYTDAQRENRARSINRGRPSYLLHPAHVGQPGGRSP